MSRWNGGGGAWRWKRRRGCAVTQLRERGGTKMEGGPEDIIFRNWMNYIRSPFKEQLTRSHCVKLLDFPGEKLNVLQKIRWLLQASSTVVLNVSLAPFWKNKSPKTSMGDREPPPIPQISISSENEKSAARKKRDGWNNTSGSNSTNRGKRMATRGKSWIIAGGRTPGPSEQWR